MASFLRDLRHGFRLLVKAPALTFLAILTISIGIGANTAIFSLLNAVLLRPLPFPEPDRLAMIWEATPLFGLRYSPAALGNYVDWRSQNRVFEEMGALERWEYRLSGDGPPEMVVGAVATASLFRALRVGPAIGRPFAEADDQPGARRAVLVSYGLWQRRLGGNPDLARLSLRVDGEPYGVVGVMPREFQFPETGTEIWLAAGARYDAREYASRGRHNLAVVGRLKAGVTLAQANEEIGAIAKRLEESYPATNRDVGAFVTPMREHMVGDSGKWLAIVFAAVCFVLLIACANVANLCLTRAVARRREIAVRVSLGAGRARIARQLAAESLLLAAAGALGGLLIAAWSFTLLERLIPSQLEPVTTLALDWRVLVFTLAISVASALLFGLAPISQALRVDLNTALKSGGERTGDASDSARLRNALVVGQVALAVVLAVGAGLLLRTLAALRGVDTGLRPERLLTMTVPVSGAQYNDPATRERFYREAVERVSSLPGVVSAGFTTGVPLVFKGWHVGFVPEGHDPSDAARDSVRYRVVTPDYFRTMGIPLRRGRNLSEADGPESPRVALVNEALARKYWPGQDPVQRRFQVSGRWGTVVGVVADVKQVGLDQPAAPEVYLPYRQEATMPAGFAVRASGDPKMLAAAIRAEVAAIDPEQPVTNIQTMEEAIDRELFSRRTQMSLIVCFAALALGLAAVGIYGTLSYFVTQRTAEIGIRMALGAQGRHIRRAVLGRALALVGCGIAAGTLAALLLTRLMSSILFGVSPRDPAVFLGIAGVLLVAGAAAAYVPARRAMRLDPVQALRR
ncbi:MAG: ABC transporter permease [Bryobacteraceae bacterium]|nr:ABC transporter permease [Bryobacteraceae bacterium]